MGGPWEDFKTESGPWEDFAPSVTPEQPKVSSDEKRAISASVMRGPEEPTSELTQQFNATPAIERPPQRQPGLIEGAVIGPVKRLAQGVNEGFGAMAGKLADVSEMVGAATGTKPGGVFRKNQETFQKGAEYSQKSAQESGSPEGIMSDVYRGVGAAPTGVAEFVAGPVYAGMEGAAEEFKKGGGPVDMLKGAAIGAGKRYAIGKGFKAIEKLPVGSVTKGAIMGGTMGAQTAAEGGGVKDVVTSVITGTAISMSGRSGVKAKIYKNAIKGGATPEAAAALADRYNPLSRKDIDLLNKKAPEPEKPIQEEVKPTVDEQAHEAATSPLNDLPQPTEAQKEAGTYKKAHIKLEGLDITVENPAGSKRTGVDETGKPWETELQSHYGYLKKTEAKDGEQVDVFVKPGTETADKVYVIDQIDPLTGKYDEPKALIGYESKEDAQAGYLANYDESGPSRIGAITETSLPDFKEWLKSEDTTKAFAKEAFTYGKVRELEAPAEPVNNASGQTDVSTEAVSELKSRKRRKIDTVIIDSRSGKERPAIGIRPEDNTANPYDVMVRRYPDGREEVIQKGLKAKALIRKEKTNAKVQKVREEPLQVQGEEVPVVSEVKPKKLKKAKEPVELVAAEDIDFLRYAEENVRSTDFGKVVTDGNVKEATLSTFDAVAPYLKDSGIKSKEKAIEVLKKAIETGQLPPAKNVAERRLVEMAIAHEKELETEAKNRVDLADEVSRYAEEHSDPAALKEALDFFDEILGVAEPKKVEPEPVDVNAKFAAEADPKTVETAKSIIKSLLKTGIGREDVYPQYNALRGKGEYLKESSFMKMFDESDARRKGAKVRNLDMGIEAEARKEEKAQAGFGFDDSMEPPTGKESKLKSKKSKKRQYDDAKDSGPQKPTPSAPKAWELPELLELARAINNGSVPRLVRNIAKGVLGRFQHSGPKIVLRKDLFAGPLLAEETVSTKLLDSKFAHFQQKMRYENPGADLIFRKTYDKKAKNWRLSAYIRDPNYILKIFSHEIGHLIDFVSEGLTKGRGNILGHIAALKRYGKEFLEKYPGAKGKPLTDADRSRLMKEARKTTPKGEDIVTVVTREVPKYEEVGITPEMIKDIWQGMNGRERFPELYKYIAEMSDGEKKNIVVQAMRGIVDERLKRFASRKQVGVETVTETIVTPAKERPEALKKRFEDLIAEEIRKRRLYEKEVVTKELEALSLKWKPFDPAQDPNYTAYRNSPSELYADAVSVLFNDPALLKADAPTFAKAFFHYMGERPEFRDAYRGITRRYRDPEGIMAERYEQSRERSIAGQEKAGEIRVEKAQKDKMTAGKLLNTVIEGLAEKNWKVLKELPDTPEGREVRNHLNEIQYIGGEVGDYVKKASDIRKEIEKAGADIHDFHEFLLAKHIIKNRNDIATEGRTAKTEQDKLDWMKKNEPKKFAAMEKAAKDFYEARKYVVKRIEESGLATDSLMEIIESRPEYVHIDVQKFMDEQYGKGTATSAGWKKHAEGTMDDINNTFVATVLQDMSILRMAKINETKRALTDVFEGIKLATVAEMKFNKNEGGMRPVEPGEGKGLLTVLRDGKPKYYVVDKHVSDTFLYDPIKSNAIVKINAYIMQYFRDILVSKNPAWMVRNIFRDFKGTVKNNPEIAWWNPADRLKLINNYRQAFKEVRADEVGKPVGKFKLGKKRERTHERSADLEFMYKNRMLTEDRMYGTREKTFDDELQQMEHAFRFVDEKSAFAAWQKAKDFYKYLDEWGQVSEKTSKLAGMKMLRSKGLKGRELASRVRERVGTPDYRRRGAWQAFTNNFFMFSNVNTQGVRAAVAAYRQDPMSYVFKTIETNVLPKVVLGLAAAGLMGDEFKKVVNKIPSWERRNYTVIPLPSVVIQPLKDDGILGENSQARITIPQDYEGQFFGSIAYDLSKGVTEYLTDQESTKTITDLRNDVAKVSPWKLSSITPLWQALANWGLYFTDTNGKDFFREKDILTREQEQYLHIEGPFNTKSMAGIGVYTWNTLGLSSLYRMDNKEFPKELTATEKSLKMTPLNTIGSFIRVDDAGHQEQLGKMIFDKRNKKAIVSYEIGDLVYDAVKEDKVNTVEDRNALRAKIRKVAKENGVAPGPYLDRLRWNIKSVKAKKEYGIRPSSRKEMKELKNQD